MFREVPKTEVRRAIMICSAADEPVPDSAGSFQSQFALDTKLLSNTSQINQS
jgi:hypothetical protein